MLKKPFKPFALLACALGIGLAVPVAAAATPAAPEPAEAMPIKAPVARVIPYKITSTLWNAEQQKAVPTPPVMIEKIKQVFALWGSVPGTGLSFRYDGLGAPAYDGMDAVPDDGRIYLVLNSRYPMGKFVAGAGGYAGEVPEHYRKGYVFFNTRAGLHALRFATMIHEIGHALGLSHGASVDSQMYCGSQLWNGLEYLAFSEQDRAALLQAWNKPGIYTLAGRVSGAAPGSEQLVHAVNVRNGRTFATLSRPDGRFEIPVLAAGEYRVFAKADESGVYESRAGVLPSWYLAQGRSTNAPYAGAILSLSPAHASVTGLEIPLIHKPVPFNMWWSAMIARKDGADDVPAFLRPGHPVTFDLIHNGGVLTRLQTYGSQPDYSLSNLRFDKAQSGYAVTVQAAPEAEPGHRLVLAPGPDGSMQAGLVGIHIIGDELPGRVKADVGEQISRQLGSAGLEPDYWQADGSAASVKPKTEPRN